jgi:3',5'-cyclic-AMP phosphodiesterase
VSHRPSWILNVALRNGDFALHRLARQYGVKYVIAGHIHQMLHFTLDGIEYLSMPSAGGHLRASGEYRAGWFFGYTVVEVAGEAAKFTIHELKAPKGEGRVTGLADWGMLGLK